MPLVRDSGSWEAKVVESGEGLIRGRKHVGWKEPDRRFTGDVLVLVPVKITSLVAET
jgi:hypothetical protein